MVKRSSGSAKGSARNLIYLCEVCNGERFNREVVQAKAEAGSVPLAGLGALEIAALGEATGSVPLPAEVVRFWLWAWEVACDCTSNKSEALRSLSIALAHAYGLSVHLCASHLLAWNNPFPKA